MQSNYISPTFGLQSQMGIQVGTYTHVLNSVFPPIDVSNVIINAVCFKKTKAPGFILDRIPIHMTPAMMYIWLETAKTYLDRINADFVNLSKESPEDPIMKSFPMNGKSCTNWGRICEYHVLCTTWLNPLQHLHQMPLSMEVNVWNPLEEELREIINI